MAKASAKGVEVEQRAGRVEAGWFGGVGWWWRGHGCEGRERGTGQRLGRAACSSLLGNRRRERGFPSPRFCEMWKGTTRLCVDKKLERLEILQRAL